MALDKRIKNAGQLAKDAYKELAKIQKGDKPILKTGQDFIDCHIGGILPSDVIMLAAGSGVGKTKLLYDTIDLMLSPDVNPKAENIVSLEYSLEMQYLNRILRDNSKQLEKKKADILTQGFTESEKQVVERYYKGLQDDRRFVCEETITDKEFFEMTRDFCESHKDKHAIIVSLDHLLLVLPENQKLDRFESISNYINQLRKMFKNVYFILLSQFNRTYQSVIADRNNEMIPRTKMIYGSSHFEFLCSYIIGLVDPFKSGVNEFMKVNRERYDWLEEYMTDEDKKGKVSFDTLGNHFYFCMKVRESDNIYKNLFIRPMDLSEEELEKMKSQVEEKPSEQFPPIPEFEDPFKGVNPIDTTKAFEEDDKPF